MSKARSYMTFYMLIQACASREVCSVPNVWSDYSEIFNINYLFSGLHSGLIKSFRIPYGSKDIPTNLWGNGSKLIKIWNNFVRDFVGVCNILKEGKHVIQQLNSWAFKRCILRYKEVIKCSLNPKSLRYTESRPAMHDWAKNCILCFVVKTTK
jgi:hypothetical protein